MPRCKDIRDLLNRPLSPLPAVTFRADLIAAASGYENDPIAKCLSSFRVVVASCQAST